MTESLVIVGPGRMGLALGASLLHANALERLIYYGRSIEPPAHPIFDPAAVRAEYRIGITPVPGGTTVLVLAIPDDALAEVAHDLAATGPAPAGCAALHMAGALSTEVLAPLHAAGYPVGSLHPLLTVADPWVSSDSLEGAGFAIAGEPEAILAARRLVSALGGRSFVIPSSLRPLYHAAAVSASNYLVVLMAVAKRLLEEAGAPPEDALPALLPLARATLDNLEHLGVAGALTGPIARGDVDTVRLHLARLSFDDRSLYCALGLEAVRLARAAGLDEARAAQLESLLTAG